MAKVELFLVPESDTPGGISRVQWVGMTMTMKTTMRATIDFLFLFPFLISNFSS